MKILTLMLVLLFTAVPFVASAEQARTIDELVKMYDSSSCKECHAEIYEQWEKSHHARSLMGIKGYLILKGVLNSAFAPKDLKQATRKTFPCFKCHLPQALDAADSVSVEIAQAVAGFFPDRAKISKLRITCLVCHNKKAILHRLQLGKPEKGVLYGTKDVPEHEDKTYKTVKKSAIIKRAVFCGQCHGTGPNFDAENPYQCATLYGSYLHNYIPGGGTQTCQECHMEPIDGMADHLTPPDWNNRPQSSELLKKAFSFDVQTLGYQFLSPKKKPIPTVVVNTKVKHNAGHRIPDG
ncbi:MAG: multiheme c-type cytochrome ExtKL [Pseudomonadota bacterium]